MFRTNFPISFLVLIFCASQFGFAQTTTVSIGEFRVQALYRAAKLTWNLIGEFPKPLSLQILRAETLPEGPYKEIATITLSPGKKSYEYIDKSMGTEAKYYYKLVIKESGDSSGPLPTRPYFSPPAT